MCPFPRARKRSATIRIIAGMVLCALLPAISAASELACVGAGEWTIPGAGRVAGPDILARSARAQVLLLGEHHDERDDHRWEMQTVAAVGALREKLVLGFEMFPRRVQGTLDRWVANELSEEEFLKAVDWPRVWGFDPAFYLPLFHYARLNRVPMVALNVERDLVRSVRVEGFDSVAPEKREGVSQPAPAAEGYLERLFTYYKQHPENGEAKREDAAFWRFVEAQLVWDRAMAQALVDAAKRHPDALVIGIMGSGHVERGDGVQHQIEALGIKRIASLVPWDHGADCTDFKPGFATAAFGLPAPLATPAPPLLGVRIEAVAGGVKVAEVSTGSVAEAAGLRTGDVLFEVAGTSVSDPGEVRSIVTRIEPGTWLPLKARREHETLELTAKFPAKK